jgi:hypothetical protein
MVMNMEKGHKDNPLSIKIEEYSFKCFYEDDKWMEHLTNHAMEVYLPNTENNYLDIAADIYEVILGMEKQAEFMFCERTVRVTDNDKFKDSYFKGLTIEFQTGKEDKKGIYNVDPIIITTKKAMNLAKFMRQCSHAYLNPEKLGLR